MEMECTGLGHAGQARILWAAAAIDSEPKQVEVCRALYIGRREFRGAGPSSHRSPARRLAVDTLTKYSV